MLKCEVFMFYHYIELQHNIYCTITKFNQQVSYDIYINIWWHILTCINLHVSTLFYKYIISFVIEAY